MSNLPDDIWTRILETGVESTRLTYRDLCCLSITCRRLHRLSNHLNLWSTLLSLDFPPRQFYNTTTTLNSKLLYKTRYERERELKVLAHKRAVLRVESEKALCFKNLRDLRSQLLKENDKFKATSSELAHLKIVRQASVALNVWQPEIVRGCQKQLVEQCAVPVEQRIRHLEMELKISKNQIEMLNNRYNDQKLKLDSAEKRLASLKYHPTREYRLNADTNDRGAKQKKLKRSIDSDGKHPG